MEFHDEAQVADPAALADRLAETGLPVLGLNVRMGETSGCAAVPGAEAQARRDIDAAAAVADAIGAGAIHVLSGKAEGEAARASLVGNLRHALGGFGGTMLIEPICRAAIPGYFLNDLDLASAILAEVDHPRLKILFDCFHVETEHGRCLERFRRAAGLVGHVQIASVPGRTSRRSGDLDYAQSSAAHGRGRLCRRLRLRVPAPHRTRDDARPPPQPARRLVRARGGSPAPPRRGQLCRGKACSADTMAAMGAGLSLLRGNLAAASRERSPAAPASLRPTRAQARRRPGRCFGDEAAGGGARCRMRPEAPGGEVRSVVEDFGVLLGGHAEVRPWAARFVLDLQGDVGVVLEELLGVLAALADALVGEGVRGARFVHDAGLTPRSRRSPC